MNANDDLSATFCCHTNDRNISKDVGVERIVSSILEKTDAVAEPETACTSKDKKQQGSSDEGLSDSFEIIRPWHVVLGDTRLDRTTVATTMLRNIKESFAQKYKGQKRSTWSVDAVKLFDKRLSEMFQSKEDGGRVLVKCTPQQTKTLKLENRLLFPDLYGFQGDKHATYVIAKKQESLKLYFESREPPTLDKELTRHRKNLKNLLKAQEPPPKDTVNDFKDTLQFFERKLLLAEQGVPLAQKLLKSIDPIHALQEQWTALIDSKRPARCADSSGCLPRVWGVQSQRPTSSNPKKHTSDKIKAPRDPLVGHSTHTGLTSAATRMASNKMSKPAPIPQVVEVPKKERRKAARRQSFDSLHNDTGSVSDSGAKDRLCNHSFDRSTHTGVESASTASNEPGKGLPLPLMMEMCRKVRSNTARTTGLRSARNGQRLVRDNDEKDKSMERTNQREDAFGPIVRGQNKRLPVPLMLEIRKKYRMDSPTDFIPNEPELCSDGTNDTKSITATVEKKLSPRSGMGSVTNLAQMARRKHGKRVSICQMAEILVTSCLAPSRNHRAEPPKRQVNRYPSWEEIQEADTDDDSIVEFKLEAESINRNHTLASRAPKNSRPFAAPTKAKKYTGSCRPKKMYESRPCQAPKFSFSKRTETTSLLSDDASLLVDSSYSVQDKVTNRNHSSDSVGRDTNVEVDAENLPAEKDLAKEIERAIKWLGENTMNVLHTPYNVETPSAEQSDGESTHQSSSSSDDTKFTEGSDESAEEVHSLNGYEELTRSCDADCPLKNDTKERLHRDIRRRFLLHERLSKKCHFAKEDCCKEDGDSRIQVFAHKAYRREDPDSLCRQDKRFVFPHSHLQSRKLPVVPML